jgi:hypothetical protein
MRRDMSRARFVTFLVAAAVAASTVPAQEATLKLVPSPLVLPLRIGPLVGKPEGRKYEQAALGTSYMYGASGTVLSVYIYDADQKDLADGPDTIPVCHEYEFAKQGVAQAYPGAKAVSERMVRLLPPAEAPLMREAVYEYTHQGKNLVSYVWITAVAKQFIKLRFSVDASLRDEIPDARRAVLAAFGVAIKPHLAPVDPAATKPGATIGLNSAMMEENGASALLYTMFLNAVADDQPELAPVCGGEFVPPFETEVSLFRSLFTGDEPTDDSRFGKLMAKAEAGGFLEELIWVEMHRESWGTTPPDGLTLAEYQAWKKKNLKRFKAPTFGTVTIDHPRALPLEPM